MDDKEYLKQLYAGLTESNQTSINKNSEIESFLGPGKSSSFNGSYDPKQLKMGIEVEKEHTNNPLIAERIAKDHLAELPDYYTRLEKMEEEGKKFHGISEHTNMSRMTGKDKKPSPAVAYELVYGRPAPSGMRGQYPGNYETKMWNGFKVDVHLEDKWLNDLNKIKQIEMRASCEGHEKNWITFIAFRVMPNKDNDIKYLEKIKSRLNQGIIKCGYEVGQQGRPRFIVAAKLWYRQPGWEKFWSSLATRVQQAVR